MGLEYEPPRLSINICIPVLLLQLRHPALKEEGGEILWNIGFQNFVSVRGG